MTLALSLIEKVGYIIAFYLLFKSVPADKVKDALATAATDAQKTAYVWDDMAVKIGQVLADALMKAQGEQRAPKQGETIIETNVIHTTGDRNGEAAAMAMTEAMKTATP